MVDGPQVFPRIVQIAQNRSVAPIIQNNPYVQKPASRLNSLDQSILMQTVVNMNAPIIPRGGR